MGANTRDATALDYFAGTRIKYPVGAGNIGIAHFHVDMAQVAADLGVTIDGNNADIVQMWDIPYPCHIISVCCKIITAEGAASTVAIGDGTQAAGFLAAFSLATADALKATLTTDAYGATCGKTYVAADTLDLTFATDTDIDTAVFDIAVLMAQFAFPDYDLVAPAAWH